MNTDWSRVTLPNTPSNQEPGKVVVNPSNVTLNITSKTLLAGETLQLTCKVTPSTAEQEVTWSVDDENVASVDENGLVTAIGSGSSLASYVSDGYYNDFFLNSHPGDTVIIESGINDSAAGRRYSDATHLNRVGGVYVKAQTEGSTTLVWSILEDSLCVRWYEGTKDACNL